MAGNICNCLACVFILCGKSVVFQRFLINLPQGVVKAPFPMYKYGNVNICAVIRNARNVGGIMYADSYSCSLVKINYRLFLSYNFYIPSVL